MKIFATISLMLVNIKHTVSADSTPDAILDLILTDRVSNDHSQLAARSFPDLSRDYITPPHPTTLSLKDFGFEQSYIDEALEHILSLHPSMSKESVMDNPSLGRGDHEVVEGVSNKIHPYNHSLLQLASEKRKSMTPSEVLIWSVLKNNGIGYDFHRQKVIGDYIVDYYCPDLQLVLEIDGKYHEYSVNTDAQRQQYLESLGISVIRIQNEDIRDGIDVWIKKKCDERAKLLTPSPASIGGSFPKEASSKNPSLGTGDHAVVEGVRNAIVVYSDYDADGITGGAILWEAMHSLGFKVHPYIGDRIEEGYGLSSIGIDKIKEKYDPALIITVDHGISGKDQVAYAKSIGIDVIVTDHHHRSEERVPTDAKAIFHIPALSGSGVAYYVAKEISEQLQTRQNKLQAASKTQQESVLAARSSTPEAGPAQLLHLFHTDYLALASIGTIADLVPLTGPSRAIAKYGLQALTKTTRAGLLALYKVAGHLGKTISPYEVGFQIAPRINASGRLDSALDALRLLCTTSATRAHVLADKLNTLNQDRQDMTKRATEEAIQIVEKMKDANGTLPKLLIVYQPSVIARNANDVAISPPSVWWHEGIIGLIASKLVEKYYRPVIVLTPSEQISSNKSQVPNNSQVSNRGSARGSTPEAGTAQLEAVLKASARSISGFHLADFLARHQKLLLRYGGHAAAAGLSINSEQLEQFSNEAVKDADSLITTEMLEKTLKVDVDIPLKLATIELAEKLETLEPYGMSNPRPVFQSSGTIQEIRTMGKENQHLKIKLGSDERRANRSQLAARGSTLDLLSFGKAAEYAHLKRGTQVKVVYTLDINEWQGNRTPQGKVLYLSEIS